MYPIATLKASGARPVLLLQLGKISARTTRMAEQRQSTEYWRMIKGRKYWCSSWETSIRKSLYTHESRCKGDHSEKKESVNGKKKGGRRIQHKTVPTHSKPHLKRTRHTGRSLGRSSSQPLDTHLGPAKIFLEAARHPTHWNSMAVHWERKSRPSLPPSSHDKQTRDGRSSWRCLRASTRWCRTGTSSRLRQFTYAVKTDWRMAK